MLKTHKNIIKKIIGFSILLFTIIIAVIAIVNVKKIDILPDKYFYLLIIGEIVFSIISGVLLIKTKKIIWLILGIILIIFMNIGNILLASYVHKTNKFINKTFKEYMVISTDYVLVTSS